MPGFTYVAVDKRGKEKRGSIEADNKEKDYRYPEKTTG